MKAADGSETAKRPGRDGAGAFLESGSNDFRSIAAVHQAPARAPRRRNQSARIAAAVAVTIAGAADVEARSAPAPAAAMPATVPAAAVPAMTAPGRGRGRR